jgi:ATP-dependent Lhr-like helicase
MRRSWQSTAKQALIHIRGSAWQIIHPTEDKVYVRPVDDPSGSIPSWIGEEIPVPYAVAQELASLRGFVEEKIQSGTSPEDVSALLSERYPADKETIQRAIAETIEQVNMGIAVPTLIG